jgi:uncharacterized protein YuzE
MHYYKIILKTGKEIIATADNVTDGIFIDISTKKEIKADEIQSLSSIEKPTKSTK